MSDYEEYYAVLLAQNYGLQRPTMTATISPLELVLFRQTLDW